MGRLSLKGNTVNKFCFLVNFSNFHKETDKMNRALLILVIVAVAAQVTIAAPQKEKLFWNWFKPTTKPTTTTESGVTGASGGGNSGSGGSTSSCNLPFPFSIFCSFLQG